MARLMYWCEQRQPRQNRVELRIWYSRPYGWEETRCKHAEISCGPRDGPPPWVRPCWRKACGRPRGPARPPAGFPPAGPDPRWRPIPRSAGNLGVFASRLLPTVRPRIPDTKFNPVLPRLTLLAPIHQPGHPARMPLPKEHAAPWVLAQIEGLLPDVGSQVKQVVALVSIAPLRTGQPTL